MEGLRVNMKGLMATVPSTHSLDTQGSKDVVTLFPNNQLVPSAKRCSKRKERQGLLSGLKGTLGWFSFIFYEYTWILQLFVQKVQLVFTVHWRSILEYVDLQI